MYEPLKVQLYTVWGNLGIVLFVVDNKNNEHIGNFQQNWMNGSKPTMQVVQLEKLCMYIFVPKY